jgi:hypothetical protein
MDNLKEIRVGNRVYIVRELDKVKSCNGSNYNFRFYKDNGFFARWGRTKRHNPSFSPIGPEIMDIEITTKCEGVSGIPCAFCYKSNTPRGSTMPLKTFKKIFKVIPPSVCQIAFGVDSHCTTNPDCWDIFHYTRDNGVIPNLTVAEIDDETAKELAKVMGAVSVTAHEDKQICYDSVQRLATHALQTGILRQINIHVMVSKETEQLAYDVLKDSVHMNFVNSVVLLALKQRGRGIGFTPLSQEEFNKLVKYAFKVGAKIGFDSCNCHKFLEAVKEHPQYESFKLVAEPCESACFSLYVDVKGNPHPCSFLEGNMVYAPPLQKVVDFQNEVWYAPEIVKFRNRLIRRKRRCPEYNI